MASSTPTGPVGPGQGISPENVTPDDEPLDGGVARLLLRGTLDLARAANGDRFVEACCAITRGVLDCRWVALLRLTADPGRDTIMSVALAAGVDGPVLARRVPEIRASLGAGSACVPSQGEVVLLGPSKEATCLAAAVVGADADGRYVLVFAGEEAGADRPVGRARLFLPYLAEAIMTRRFLDEARARQLADAEMLDRAPCGFLVLDAEGTILYANAEARRITSAADGLAASGGRLVASDVNFRRVLASALDALASGCSLPDVQGERLERPSGAAAYAVALVPVVISGRRAFIVPRRRLLVTVTDPLPQTPPAADYLMRTFGLTSGEARICGQVASGRSLDAAAESLGLSIGTVKSHLRNVYHKLQVSSRAALVHRVQGHTWSARPVVVEVEGSGAPVLPGLPGRSSG